MIYYLTFNDLPSGVFSSQVVDLISFLKNELKAEIRLVSFISIRNYRAARRRIKDECPQSIIFPMVPGVNRWKMNRYLLKVLCLITKPDVIIGRSALATQLAFDVGIRNVVYDGRGAIAAEWSEYNVVKDPVLLSEIKCLEKTAILKSRYRIAVSEQLVDYWKETYNYRDHNHVVVPCTLNKVYENKKLDKVEILSQRLELNFDVADIVFVYSGSIAGWQSFDLLEKFIKPHLKNNKNVKLIFLSDLSDNIRELIREFPMQVSCRRVAPHEVVAYLMAADYGLLIREQSITNRVASPVKFAEYLACGLKVIISENLGDYSRFVLQKECGFFYTQFTQPVSVSFSEKEKIRKLALENFSKRSQLLAYNVLLKSIEQG